MGCFNDQIRQRQENDNSIMDESMVTLASAVLDKWNKNRIEDQRLTTKTAIQSVMKYYHQKCPDIPDNLESIGEQMEYAMRPAGIMTRDVELDKNWQNKAIGPMIGRIKETGEIVALLPGLIFGYFYKKLILRIPAESASIILTWSAGVTALNGAVCTVVSVLLYLALYKPFRTIYK